VKKTIIFPLALFFVASIPLSIITRSPHRPQDPHLPQITTYWPNSTQKYTIKDSHLEEYPIFNIHAEDLMPYTLPAGRITYRNNPEYSVDSADINRYITELLEEIKNNQQTFNHFTVLHRCDFNFNKKCGLIILKFKDHPFILKLSMERPETFFDYNSKGIIPMFFFFLSGGTNRHITGLTRISNLHAARAIIDNNPYWANRVEFPRKWFWLPSNNQWFTIEGKNIGKHNEIITTQMPSVYAIVADAIEPETIKIPKRLRNQTTMELCKDLRQCIDPHENNFIFSRNPKTNELTITVIDTEHFPTIVGLKKEEPLTSYSNWYYSLATKCLNDMFFRTKKERVKAQSEHSELIVT
jgi:hypothetical protein